MSPERRLRYHAAGIPEIFRFNSSKIDQSFIQLLSYHVLEYV